MGRKRTPGGHEDRAAVARMRRRDWEAKAYKQQSPDQEGEAVDIEEIARLNPGDDPPEYLEQLRLALIKALIRDASQTTNRELRAKICVNLLKFSSMGRTQMDVSVRREDLPDLSQLGDAALMQLLTADDQTLNAISLKLSAPLALSDGKKESAP